MTIASLNFLLFSLAAIAIHRLSARLPWRSPRDIVFLVINLFFLQTFAVGGFLGFLPMAGFVLIGYVGASVLQDHRAKKKSFWTVLGLTLAFFFWLKKYALVPKPLLLTMPYASIGVSYIFFRILQLIIDSKSVNIRSRLGFVTYLNYVLNFTTLVSGPIQRHEDFSEAERHPKPISCVASGRAIERIIFGFFKVLVLAAILDEWHNQSLDLLSAQQSLTNRIGAGAQGIVSYALYLYCNFSGYTDIVIGVARFLGIELPENFNRPFSALNFMDFWARWHMTLSNWLKTYVYNPLVKNLMVRFPSVSADPYIGAFAFLVTFFLIGVWHGQTWVFVLYGLLLGLGVSGNKLYQTLVIRRLGRKQYRALSTHWLYQAIARGMTFTYFCLSLVCFWASWSRITEICGHLGWSGAIAVAVTVLVLSTLALELWERLRAVTLALKMEDRPVVVSRYLRTAWGTALVLVTICVVSLTATPAPDIVYKSF